MWNILRVNASAFAQDNFSFSGAHIEDTAGDFVLGQLTSYSQSNVRRAGAFHQHWFEIYGQNDSKASPRLTLSYGSNRQPPHQWRRDCLPERHTLRFSVAKKEPFAPRFGFPYRLNHAGTMSLYDGYGMGYTLVGMFQTSGLISNPPDV
jgi:hypothetical protein